MKSKIFLFLLFSFFLVSLNAQVFVGGSIGFSASGGNHDNGTTTTDKPSTFNTNFSPKIGTFLSENVAIGLAIGYTSTRTKTPGSTEVIDKSSTFGLSPFLRYYPMRWNKFSAFGQLNAGYSFSSSTHEVGGSSTDGPTTTNLYFNVVPGIAYDLSEKFSLETTINILSFGYYHTLVKSGSTKDRTNNFGFGLGLDNIVTVGSISIGAIYKF